MPNKILGLYQLKQKLDAEKRAGKKVVMVSGSFDLLHTGHLYQLETAKKQGDILVVLLNSDSSVRMYKGKNRPIIKEKDRSLVLAALSCVDYVFTFHELTPLRYISMLKPDIYCNGSEWGAVCLEKDTVEKNGGRVFCIKRGKQDSTSDIVQRIISSEKKPDKKAVFLCSSIQSRKKEITVFSAFIKKHGYVPIFIPNTRPLNTKILLKLSQKKDAIPGRSIFVSSILSEIRVGKMANCKTIFVGKLPEKVSSVEYPTQVIPALKELKKIV